MKWQAEEMVSWQKDRGTKYQVNDNVMKWQVDDMERWCNKKLIKWIFDKIEFIKWKVSENGQSTKCQVQEINSWWNDKLIQLKIEKWQLEMRSR